jgi:hypothetical protein
MQMAATGLHGKQTISLIGVKALMQHYNRQVQKPADPPTFPKEKLMVSN